MYAFVWKCPRRLPDVNVAHFFFLHFCSIVDMFSQSCACVFPHLQVLTFTHHLCVFWGVGAGGRNVGATERGGQVFAVVLKPDQESDNVSVAQ